MPCFRCNRVYYDIIKHETNSHAFNNECIFCSKQFANHDNVLTHIESHHQKLIGFEGKKKATSNKLPSLQEIGDKYFNTSNPEHKFLNRKKFGIIYNANKLKYRPEMTIESLRYEESETKEKTYFMKRMQPSHHKGSHLRKIRS